jgi:hypothetical protein
MSNTTKRDNLIQYLYNELPLTDKLELENELSVNPELQQEYTSYQEVLAFMGKCTCKPSENVTQSILTKIKQGS